MTGDRDPYWSKPATEVARALDSSPQGLTAREAARRLREHGPNALRETRAASRLRVLGRQLRSPLMLLLLFAAGASAVGREWIDAGIVGAIVLVTVWIGYRREYHAETALAALLARVRIHAEVLRDGTLTDVPVREVVPGDVVHLSAGSVVPADAIVLEATDFFVSDAILTGESFPVEKRPGPVAASAGLGQRSCCVFAGTHVRSGTARCLVARTAAGTVFAEVAAHLQLRPPETEFERGLRRFGYLLVVAMLVMVILVFAVNVLLGRPPLETLLFSVALAVGLSPELLPAILSVNLARGAETLASCGVLVRRLEAIEDLGSMDVLCTDKTGTLTEGVASVDGAWDAGGAASPEVMELATLNAALQTGLENPLDHALLEAHQPDLAATQKLDEIPYDFVRKRLSVVVQRAGAAVLISKGAFPLLIEACTRIRIGAADVALDDAARADLDARYAAWCQQGIRVIAVATRALPAQPSYHHTDEQELTLVGFVTFLDHPKATAKQAVADLARLGVRVKMITGDSHLVAEHVAGAVGLRRERVLTGRGLDELSDDALPRAVEDTDLFAEVDPNQKERIIRALRKGGHVVGFFGDGVNDAPAMHAADTSLSADQAVDVAKQAADFVLMQPGLDVIRQGIEAGRRTFANTLKYILTTTSANLGNMVSMAVASAFLPFLPLLAGQILLNNLLSDLPAIGLAGDAVDPELVAKPRRWNMRFIGRFMIEFGALSSLFDLMTFAALLFLLGAGPVEFRTGWFVESLWTELAVAFVVRSRRPFGQSRPGAMLTWTSVGVALLCVAIPFIPGAHWLGFAPLSPIVLATLLAITLLYVTAAEITKRSFFRHNA